MLNVKWRDNHSESKISPNIKIEKPYLVYFGSKLKHAITYDAIIAKEKIWKEDSN
jgi:hypothetical protein